MRTKAGCQSGAAYLDFAGPPHLQHVRFNMNAASAAARHRAIESRSGAILLRKVLKGNSILMDLNMRLQAGRKRVTMHRLPGFRIPALFGVVFVLAAVGSCGSSAQKHYALRGRVLAKSTDQLTVNHGDIPGLMPAMTMPYAVKDAAEFQKVQAGDSITADLVVEGDKNWLQHVVITDTSGRDSIFATTAEEIEPGAQIPDVPLVNQDGKTIHLSDFKGKSVLITFIYTRCPFPTFCPLISNEFAALHKELLKAPGDYKRTHLVSISLDPAFDTPPVLRKYGLGIPARRSGWI